jgi:asparagine synthase (glutamine-hydrolysing)
MCGITGYMGEGNEAILKAMTSTLVHRGPDDRGSDVYGSVGFGHTRLSILDLSAAGHQPMWNDAHTVMLTFNGEIYNFQELRASLTSQRPFRGSSDTEVILRLYEEIGLQVFEKIQGMFALALYDVTTGQVILARDRLGKKPLYWGLYGNDQKTLLFGSELKALMQHPLFLKKLNLHAVNKYFLYEYVPTPHTIFEHTYKLEPGTYMIWDGMRAIKKVFWKPTFEPKTTSFIQAKKDLHHALTAAVAARLVADVPVGIFLSGGIDSSVIAHYATKAARGKIKTFSIGFDDESFDESFYARQVARHVGSEHHQKIVSTKDVLDIIPRIAALDEPLADASIIPTYILSHFTRQHVTVALGGDGGDELFCGYDTFTAHRLAHMVEKMPTWMRKGIARCVQWLPTSFANMSFDFKAKKFMEGFEGDPKYRNQRWLGAFSRDERERLFLPHVWQKVEKENEFSDIDAALAGAEHLHTYDQLGLEYKRLYMMDQVLVKVDRASMLTSLEVRAPLLDTRVVDVANHMPVQFKFRFFEKKFILKRLMEGYLPYNIIYRKKKGFGMPVARWLRGDLRLWMEELLSESSLAPIGLFNIEYVRTLMSEHQSGKVDHRKRLWTLLMFVVWWKKWVGEKV